MDVGTRAQQDIKTMYFTMSKNQYETLKQIKKESFVKILYLIRLGALIVIKKPSILKWDNDNDYAYNSSKHYQIAVKKDIYEKICELSENTKMSKSKILRIGINEIIKLYREECEHEQ